MRERHLLNNLSSAIIKVGAPTTLLLRFDKDLPEARTGPKTDSDQYVLMLKAETETIAFQWVTKLQVRLPPHTHTHTHTYTHTHTLLLHVLPVHDSTPHTHTPANIDLKVRFFLLKKQKKEFISDEEEDSHVKMSTPVTMDGADSAFADSHKRTNRSGYLWKRAVNSGRNWKRRFFVLSEDSLAYFVDGGSVEGGKAKVGHRLPEPHTHTRTHTLTHTHYRLV